MLPGILIFAVVLHFAFMLGEMLPWKKPAILASVLKEKSIDLDDKQLQLVSTIVHNAGIYNFILAAGFLWCRFPDRFGSSPEPVSLKMIQTFFFAAAIVAGLFGLSLSRKTMIQAVVGIAGLVALYM